MRTGRSGRRASLGSTSWSGATTCSSPRSTRSRASRRSASSRRCPRRAATRSATSAPSWSTWPSSATPGGRAGGSRPPTCPADRHVTGRTPRYRAAAGTPRRRARVRRASGRFTPVRAAALLVMLVAAGAIYGAAGTPAFGYERLELSGNVLTPASAIRDRLGVPTGTNLFGLATGPIVERLRELPAVAGAEISIGLPDVLRIGVAERRAVVLWGVGSHRYAVDDAGLLFAEVGPDAPETIAALPVVLDQ